ncbi:MULTISPECIES: HNH endonuclease [unclassified Streptomyces]|uniref:HNH endonuclease n=1 Tax=unclassified Streptomyces TaxID=2593676 RepID=UPI003FA3DC64
MCGRPGNVQVHHIRRPADLGNPGEQQPGWAALVIKRRRKTRVLCTSCREAIHVGQPAT